MNARPLNIVRGLLKSGLVPEDMPGAKFIGNGCDRDAYLVPAGDTSLVVKRASSWMRRNPLVQPLPIRRAPTVMVQVGGTIWEIQKHYTLVKSGQETVSKWHSSQEYHQGTAWGYDLHAGNIGVDSRGRFVAFDW